MSSTGDSFAGINEKLDLVLKKVDQMDLQVKVAKEIISAHSGVLTEGELARAEEFGLYTSGITGGLSSFLRSVAQRLRKIVR